MIRPLRTAVRRGERQVARSVIQTTEAIGGGAGRAPGGPPAGEIAGTGGAGSRFYETDALVAYIEPYDAEVISLYARGMSVREMEGVAPRPASCWAAAAPAFPRTNTQPVAADLENTATLSCPRNVYRTTPDGSASIF